ILTESQSAKDPLTEIQFIHQLWIGALKSNFLLQKKILSIPTSFVMKEQFSFLNYLRPFQIKIFMISFQALEKSTAPKSSPINLLKNPKELHILNLPMNNQLKRHFKCLEFELKEIQFM